MNFGAKMAAMRAIRNQSQIAVSYLSGVSQAYINRAENGRRELNQDEDELSQRRMEEFGTAAENIIGLLGKRRRRLTTSLTKRRLTSQARANVDESKQAIADYQRQIETLAKEKQQAEQQVNEAWAKKVDDVTEVTVTPLRKDLLLDLFGMVWSPYFVIKSGNQTIELPAFKS